MTTRAPLRDVVRVQLVASYAQALADACQADPDTAAEATAVAEEVKQVHKNVHLLALTVRAVHGVASVQAANWTSHLATSIPDGVKKAVKAALYASMEAVALEDATRLVGLVAAAVGDSRRFVAMSAGDRYCVLQRVVLSRTEPIADAACAGEPVKEVRGAGVGLGGAGVLPPTPPPRRSRRQ